MLRSPGGGKCFSQLLLLLGHLRLRCFDRLPHIRRRTWLGTLAHSLDDVVSQSELPLRPHDVKVHERLLLGRAYPSKVVSHTKDHVGHLLGCHRRW